MSSLTLVQAEWDSIAEALYAGEQFKDVCHGAVRYDISYFYPDEQPWWAEDNTRYCSHDSVNEIKPWLAEWMNARQEFWGIRFKRGIRFEPTEQGPNGDFRTAFHLYVPPWYIRVEEAANLIKASNVLVNASQWNNPWYPVEFFEADRLKMSASKNEYDDLCSKISDIQAKIKEWDNGQPVELFRNASGDVLHKTARAARAYKYTRPPL